MRCLRLTCRQKKATEQVIMREHILLVWFVSDFITTNSYTIITVSQCNDHYEHLPQGNCFFLFFSSTLQTFSNVNRISASKCVIEAALTHCCACRTPPVWMWVDVIDAGISIIIIKVSLLWIIVPKCIVMSETSQVLIFAWVAQNECRWKRNGMKSLCLSTCCMSDAPNCCNDDRLEICISLPACEALVLFI